MTKKHSDKPIAFRAAMEIQKAAAAADMTVAAFAEMHGISLQNVYCWRRGRMTPKAQSLAALHRAGIDVLYVLTGEINAASGAATSEAAGVMAVRLTALQAD